MIWMIKLVELKSTETVSILQALNVKRTKLMLLFVGLCGANS